MTRIRTKIAEGGRIVIPAEFRRALGMDVGDEVILDLGEGQLTVLTPRQAVKHAQELVRRLYHTRPPGKAARYPGEWHA